MCRKGYADGACSGWGPGMGAWVAARWLVVRDLRLLRVFAVLRDGDGGSWYRWDQGSSFVRDEAVSQMRLNWSIQYAYQ